MNLYEIDNEIMNCIDEETGEIVDVEKLDSLVMERDVKIENICLWIKNLKADAVALKAEKDNFATRQKAAENKAESLTKYISNYLNGDKYKSARVTVSYRKSEAVNITDISQIPTEYIKPAEPQADKTAIKNAIKSGTAIPGAEIIENQNIQIK